jgi:hypothetical protein
MIGYVQKSGRGGQVGERIDLVVLVKHSEAEHTPGRNMEILVVQTTIMF